MGTLANAPTSKFRAEVFVTTLILVGDGTLVIKQKGSYTRVYFFVYLTAVYMAFYPIDGDWKIMYFRKKASTAFSVNHLVAFETNGGAGDPIEPADASDAEILGICLKKVASTDSDYASNTRIPVLVPVSKASQMEGDVGTGTLTVADEGLEVDLKDSDEVDQSASATDVLVCTSFISASKGLFVINKPALV